MQTDYEQNLLRDQTQFKEDVGSEEFKQFAKSLKPLPNPVFSEEAIELCKKNDLYVHFGKESMEQVAITGAVARPD